MHLQPPESEPTCEAAATFLALLDLVFIAFGTLASVLSDREWVTGDFLLMATPCVVGMVLPVEAPTNF